MYFILFFYALCAKKQQGITTLISRVYALGRYGYRFALTVQLDADTKELGVDLRLLPGECFENSDEDRV